MYTIENKGIVRPCVAGMFIAALSMTGCVSKTATLHSPPYFKASPTRETTNAVDQGDGDLEIANLRRVMMSHPDDVEARLRLAQAYAVRGFPDVALEHYRLAAERFPGSVDAALGLAKALHKANQKEEAFVGFKAFVKAHPQNTSEPYEWLGILNDDLQNWKDSQLAYETALLHSPNSAELHNNLGYALLMQYQNNSAAMEFRAALRIKHDMVIARNNLGIALAADPDAKPNEAILNWQAVSGPAAAHNNMAALLIERGDYSGARKELGAALRYDQQNAQAIYNLALVSERDGKPAVIPAAVGTKVAGTSTAKQPSAWFRLFHPGNHAGKQSTGQTLSAGQAPERADRAIVPSGNGSGN